MNIQEFRTLMENTPDKISAIKKNISQFKFSITELTSVVNDIFTDREKVECLSILKPKYWLPIIKSIDSNDIKMEVMKNDELTANIQKYNYVELLNSLHDTGKLTILHDKEFLNSKRITKYDIVDIIKSMADTSKNQVFNDAELKEIYKLTKSDYLNIIKSMEIASIEQLLENKELLLSLIDKNNVDRVVQDCSDAKKKEVILSDKYPFNSYNVEKILAHFDIPNLFDFIQENSEFLQDKEIHLHNVVKALSKEKQLEFVTGMESVDINLSDKLKTLVVLKDEAKAELDRTGMNERYLQALEMKLDTEFDSNNYGNLDVDLDSDLSKYQGLDELITISPQGVPFYQHYKLIELAKICPNLKVKDNIDLSLSTGQEFIDSEEWISDVLSNIKEDWSDIQKAAYIDHRVGKKISYTPDFDTEVTDQESARALWRIIDSGYGVCNGIAQVEQYLLSHVGIESELVSSGRHTFLKVNDIEIPREDGTTIKGDTLLDPTWNLTTHKYDAYPNLFARSYEEIRKCDKSDDGTDCESHKVKGNFLDNTIDIEEKVLVEVYKSIGLAKENGNFPISDMMSESDRIAVQDIPIDEKITKQLDLLTNYHPDFSMCQNSTISIIAGNILKHPEMSFKKLVVNRVYNRRDENKTPAVFVYYNAGKEKERFFVAEPGSKSFSYKNKDDFIIEYECYEKDMEKTDGLRPWEAGAKEVKKDLNRSSGKVVAEKGEKEGYER